MSPLPLPVAPRCAPQYHGSDPEGEGMAFMRPLMALAGYENRGVTNFTS
jgi:hypothetical protein